MKTNILVFGDSITYGCADLELGGWVNRLRLDLDARFNYAIKVFNMGISDATTVEILGRFDSECGARHEQGNKTIIVFFIGINDAQTIKDASRVPIEGFEGNVRELISRSYQYTKDIVFVGLPRVDETQVKKWLAGRSKLYVMFYNDKIIKYDNIIQKICREQKVSYIKMCDLLQAEDLADGLHPNEKGHEKIFKRVLENLDTMIK